MRGLLSFPKRWLVVGAAAALVAAPTGVAAARGDHHPHPPRHAAGHPGHHGQHAVGHRDHHGQHAVGHRDHHRQHARGSHTVATHPMAIDPMSYDYGHTLATLTGAQLETTFMGGMVPHHEVAIAMARLELQRGSNGKIRHLARAIITSQSQEVAQMTAWLKKWYGVTPQQAVAQAPAPAPTQIQAMDTMMQNTMIAPLQATPAGPGFDIKFVSLMIPHHQMAILETPPVQDNGTHRSLVDMANTIALSQEQQVIEMLHWLQTHGS